MRNLFNASFLKFTFGFLSILLASFVLIVALSHINTRLEDERRAEQFENSTPSLDVRFE